MRKVRQTTPTVDSRPALWLLAVLVGVVHP